MLTDGRVHARPRVALVGCSRSKLDRRATAQTLYTGALFERALNLALLSAEEAFVVSARHGLLAMDEDVDPYQFSIDDLSPEERVAWGRKVVDDLRARVPRPSAVRLYMGEKYATPLRAPLALLAAETVADAWPSPEEPLRGLQIGERLRWLNRAIADLGGLPC